MNVGLSVVGRFVGFLVVGRIVGEVEGFDVGRWLKLKNKSRLFSKEWGEGSKIVNTTNVGNCVGLIVGEADG